MFFVKFADIGEGIHEGVLLKVLVALGQSIHEGEDLFTLETDKVNAEIPSPTDGIVKEIRFSVGAKVNVGDVIIVLDDGKEGSRSNMEGGEVTAEPVAEAKGASVVGQIEVSSNMIPSSGEGQIEQTNVQTNHKILATPVARKMAKDLGVDIQHVIGTGPNGRVMKADIRSAADPVMQTSKAAEQINVPAQQINAPAEQSSAQADQISAQAVQNSPSAGQNKKLPKLDLNAVDRVPLTMLRKTVAQNMVLSKFTIPHTLVMDEADVQELVKFRSEAKGLAEKEGVKLTYLAFFVKAVVLGLKKYAYLNASLDSERDEILLKRYFNIGIAVDTPDGLMVPVIKHADKLSLFEIANAIETLTEKARTKTISLEELSDGTFTITNYGAVGASFGAPIIKFPEAGILGVGAIVKKPVVVDDEIVIRSILPLSLSFDHRIIDGADAGRFVGYVKALLASPQLLILK